MNKCTVRGVRRSNINFGAAERAGQLLQMCVVCVVLQLQWCGSMRWWCIPVFLLRLTLCY